MNEDEINDDTFNSMKMLAIAVIIGTVVFSAFVAACLILYFK